MSESKVMFPSKPRIVSEKGFSGVYEIDGLYPGYGHTLGNSLRRIVLSSIPGAAITEVKITGVDHEFSSIAGVKEDVITILLNLKKVRIKLSTDEAQTINLSVKGIKKVTAGDIEHPGQVEILNPELVIAELTDKNSNLTIEMKVEKGLGYVPREVIQKDRVDIGSIALDASFTPITRANYEVENMRVGDRTDFNRLRLIIETDGTLTPKEALEYSIKVMIEQLKAIVGFEEPITESVSSRDESFTKEEASAISSGNGKELDVEFLKTRIDAIGLSPRTVKSLSSANIRTIGGLARKKESDILEVDGLGSKGMQEIKKVLSSYGISLK